MPWGTIVGAMIAAAASRQNQSDATDENKNAMQSRHQWEVEDLKAAGLNPILSAGGSGTPGMPSAPGAPVPDFGATITNALQTDSNIDLQKAQADLTRAKTKIEEARIPSEETKSILWEEGKKLLVWWKQTSGEIADELRNTINQIQNKLKELKLPTFKVPWSDNDKNSNRSYHNDDYGTHIAP